MIRDSELAAKNETDRARCTSAALTVHFKGSPGNDRLLQLYLKRFERAKGLSYIATWCLRTTPTPPRQRSFTAHDQTETDVHER